MDQDGRNRAAFGRMGAIRAGKEDHMILTFNSAWMGREGPGRRGLLVLDAVHRETNVPEPVAHRVSALMELGALSTPVAAEGSGTCFPTVLPGRRQTRSLHP